MLSKSATFHALTMIRRESGLCLIVSTASVIWSIDPPLYNPAMTAIGNRIYMPKATIRVEPTRSRCVRHDLADILRWYLHSGTITIRR